VRAFSALCGVATVPVAYAAGAALASRRAGVIAAFFVATSPLLVWYSQEARAYALFAFCGALSFLFFARALRRPSAGELACWLAASAATLASHYFGVFLVAAEAALLLALTRRPRPVVLASGAVVAAGLALLPLALYQERGGRTAWIDDTPLGERARDSLRELVAGMYPLPHGATLAVVVLVGAVAFVLVGARADERRNAFVALGVGVLTLVLPLALALAGVDYFLTRNLLVAWLPIATFLAVALASDRARWAGAAVAGVLVATSAVVVGATASRDDLVRDDWRAVAESLATPGTKLVAVAPEYERTPLEYYRPNVRPLGGRRISADEIVLLGYPLEDDGFPPRWLRVPPGFRRIEFRLFDRIRMVRFRASGPSSLDARDLGSPSPAAGIVLVDEGGR
jgi:4-amino-4-deoxy-L-arabinose transferase-like glycosyltransferase